MRRKEFCVYKKRFFYWNKNIIISKSLCLNRRMHIKKNNLNERIKSAVIAIRLDFTCLRFISMDKQSEILAARKATLIKILLKENTYIFFLNLFFHFSCFLDYIHVNILATSILMPSFLSWLIKGKALHKSHVTANKMY